MFLKSLRFFGLFSIILSFNNCSEMATEKVAVSGSVNASQINKASWLIGSWQNVSGNETSTEIWEKKNDSTFVAKSFVTVNKDTVFSETISIEQRGNALFYIPTVKEQNQGQAVEFVLIDSNKDQLEFENLKHDFPQKIIYKKITNDSILATISGIEKGEQKTIQFPFKRTH